MFSLVPFNTFLSYPTSTLNRWSGENRERVRRMRKRGRQYLEGREDVLSLLDVLEDVVDATVDTTLEFSHGYRGRLDQRMEVGDDKITLEIEMPGVKREGVEVLEKNGVFSFKWKRGEREYSRVYKLARRGEGWNLEECKLRLEDGILTLEIPKVIPTEEGEERSPPEGRKIPIE